jgi:hypothetical protein
MNPFGLKNQSRLDKVKALVTNLGKNGVKLKEPILMRNADQNLSTWTMLQEPGRCFQLIIAKIDEWIALCHQGFPYPTSDGNREK